MKLLLDTHVWLWAVGAPDRLGAGVRARLLDPSTTRLLSTASAWEIAVKCSTGRMTLPDPPSEYVAKFMRETCVDLLPIDLGHALAVADLIRHHGDPFDRLLIAQAQVEGIPIVTADRAFDAYDVEVIRATD